MNPPSNYFDIDRIKAVCTWGEGPDVMIVDAMDGEETVFIDLTARQATKLAIDLIKAAEASDFQDMEYYRWCLKDIQEPKANQDNEIQNH